MNISDFSPTIAPKLPKQALRSVPDLPFAKVASGKVREMFDCGEALLMIATDRLSAFDVILPDGIPGKGILLTEISRFWFNQTASIFPNHLLPDQNAALEHLLVEHRELIPRAMLVRKLRPLPIEAVVRAYLSGSGWKSYLRERSLFGQLLPGGLKENEALPEPFFTPTTKAGQDLPLSLEECAKLLGQQRFEQVREASFKIFAAGQKHAQQAGLILADSKFEFGEDAEGHLYLIDEVLTPDSSRFWPAESYQPGGPCPSFDKQFVRDYLETLAWNKKPPAPSLPAKVIEGTQARYLEALRKLALPTIEQRHA